MRTLAPLLAALLACACAGPGTDPSNPESRGSELTLERVLSGPSFTRSAPSGPGWSPDSERLAFRWAGPEGSRREIWIVEADGSDLRRLTDLTEGRSSVGSFLWMPGGENLLYTRDGELRRTDLAGRSTTITRIGGSAFDLRVSPDGRHASFLRQGDLWLLDLSGGEPARMTNVSVPPISKVPYGRYRRRDTEIGTGIWGGPTYAWAPDSKTIAVHHVDRSELPKVSFPHYLGKDTDPNLVRRSYPGQPNEKRTVGLLDISSGELNLLDLPDQDAVQIVGFSWSKNGQLLLDRATDNCVDRWLHVYDPGTKELRELWNDSRETRVYTTMGSTWHSDGEHVVMLGDLADRYGLYSLSFDRRRPKLLSELAGDVTESPIVTDDGSIFYQSNAASPYQRRVHRSSLAANPMQVTDLRGDTRPYPSPDGRRLAFLRSSDTSPTDLYLLDTKGDSPARRLTDSRTEEFLQFPWADVQYLQFPSLDDGATIHARLLTPPDIDPERRYPVIFGPIYSNTVRNRWGGYNAMLQQMLVQKGYLVVQVDVRGSTGYGREFREQFLMDFAGQDLDDLESAVAYLESQSWVDPDRIGIWGSSYGGTLTAYALLKKPGLFDAGVACAAAVDPYFFGSDDIAIVRRPDTHPEAFERGAAQYAENLEDPLLLIHGMQDQIVPFKTIVDLAEALMRAGKDFDMAIAPAGTHGWTRPRHYGRYLLGKLVAHFDRHLLDK